jgi:hypothetical protein
MISRDRLAGYRVHRERRAETLQVALLDLLDRYVQWKRRFDAGVTRWMLRLLIVAFALLALVS